MLSMFQYHLDHPFTALLCILLLVFCISWNVLLGYWNRKDNLNPKDSGYLSRAVIFFAVPIVQIMFYLSCGHQ